MIDEDSLCKAIQSGRLRGVVLDAFTEESPNPNHPLLAMPQLIATPHLGARTDGATNSMGWMAFNDCLAVLRGEPSAHPFNT